MEIIVMLLEIFDVITYILALCFGIFIVPYSIYNGSCYIINKIKYWRYLYENRRLINKD